ncbi:hypothetical protein [uncultured Methylobacterium sp.]|uniref:hypothetical protein n=1 Tax=uncultured Methylobacterium sp. TaxID=157278 RepID=UPI00262A05E2|nr:hypothetical protein [uncultured Methylobacterium sp.]
MLARLRNAASDATAAARAGARGLDILALSRLHAGPPGDAAGLLLGFAAWRPAELTEAVARLDAALREAAP